MTHPYRICRICRRPLDVHVDGNDNLIAYRHTFYTLPGTVPHEPDPVPLEEVVGPAFVCDFCTAPNPTWSYPVASFTTEVETYASTDDWAACDICHDLIEAGRWRQLANRTLDTPEKADWGVEVRRQARAKLLRFHQQFAANRKGPAERIEEPPNHPFSPGQEALFREMIASLEEELS